MRWGKDITQERAMGGMSRNGPNDHLFKKKNCLKPNSYIFLPIISIYISNVVYGWGGKVWRASGK